MLQRILQNTCKKSDSLVRWLNCYNDTLWTSSWSIFCFIRNGKVRFWVKKENLFPDSLDYADGGTWTLTRSPPSDFESDASAIPPHPRLCFLNTISTISYERCCVNTKIKKCEKKVTVQSGGRKYIVKIEEK